MGPGWIEIRRRLVRFYATYKPKQLEEVGFVEKMVERYASEGEKVFGELVAQYGPEPTAVVQPVSDVDGSLPGVFGDGEQLEEIMRSRSRFEFWICQE